MDPNVIEMNPVSLSEVKNELKRIKKRDGDLSFRGNKTEDYINSIHVISEKDAKEIYSEIEALNILRLKPEHIVKIIDVMPSSLEEVKFLMSSFSLSVKKEDQEKVFKIIDARIPKKKK